MRAQEAFEVWCMNKDRQMEEQLRNKVGLKKAVNEDTQGHNAPVHSIAPYTYPLPNPDVSRVPQIPKEWIEKYDEKMHRKAEREKRQKQNKEKREKEEREEKEADAKIGFKIWVEKKEEARRK